MDCVVVVAVNVVVVLDFDIDVVVVVTVVVVHNPAANDASVLSQRSQVWSRVAVASASTY